VEFFNSDGTGKPVTQSYKEGEDKDDWRNLKETKRLLELFEVGQTVVGWRQDDWIVQMMSIG
jgi:hypothetical protein